MRKGYSWFHKGTLNCLLDITEVVPHKAVTTRIVYSDCVSSVIAVKKKNARGCRWLIADKLPVDCATQYSWKRQCFSQALDIDIAER